MRIQSIRTLLWGIAAALILFSSSGWARTASPEEILLDCQLNLLEPNTMVKTGSLRITFDHHIYWKGQGVFLHKQDAVAARLAHYTFRLLLAMVDEPDLPHSIYDLYEDCRVDGDIDGDGVEESVRQGIRRLRLAFEAVDAEFDQIKTFRSGGYFWVAGELTPDLQTGDLTVVSAVRKTTWKGQDVKLTPGQFRMFWFMIQSRGKSVDYEKLFRAYSGAVVDRRTREEMIRSMTVEIGNIRKAFKKADPEFSYIESVRAIGYGWQSQLGCTVNRELSSGGSAKLDQSSTWSIISRSQVDRICQGSK